MVSPELLEILRCPMDPEHTTPLVLEGDQLACPACGLKYLIKDGLPNFIVEEAGLPAGCDSLDQLPERHAKAAAGAG
jgi:uncharacterized protein YbaR (Trm112 family)